MRHYLPLGDLVTTPVRGMQVGAGPVCIACRKGVGGSGSGECLCLACYERIRSLRGMFCAKCKGSLMESVNLTNEPK